MRGQHETAPFLVAALAAALSACPPPPLERPPPAPHPPPREDLVPPTVPLVSEDDTLPFALPAGVSRLARVEGIAMAPQRWGEALVFSVMVTGMRIVLREPQGRLLEMPGVGGGRVGNETLAGAAVTAPDGTRILLPLRRTDGTETVVSWSGEEEERPVVFADGTWPVQVPDGSILVLELGKAGRGRSLKRFRRDADPIAVLAPRDGRTVSWPVLSPDAETVVYVDAPGGLPGADAPASIATMPLDGSSPRTLVPDGMRAGPPTFSPDGRWVIFSARPERATSRDLYAVPVTGGEPLRLSDDPGDEDCPLVWHDGDGDTLIWVARRHRAISVAIEEVDGERTLPIPPLPAYAAAPSISDDGKTIAFVVPTGHDAGVWVRVARAGEPRRIFRGQTSPTPPAFVGSATDRRIVYLAPTDRGVDLFLVAASGGAPVQLTSDGSVRGDQPPVPSPDGTEIAWIADRDRARTLVVASIDGPEPRVVARNIRFFTWASDGSFLVTREPEPVLLQPDPGPEDPADRVEGPQTVPAEPVPTYPKGRTVLSLLREGGEEPVDLPLTAGPSWRPLRVIESGEALFVLERIDRPRLLRIERSSGDVSTVLELPASSDPARSNVFVDPPGRWAMTFVSRTSSEIRSRPRLRDLLPAE